MAGGRLSRWRPLLRRYPRTDPPKQRFSRPQNDESPDRHPEHHLHSDVLYAQYAVLSHWSCAWDGNVGAYLYVPGPLRFPYPV